MKVMKTIGIDARSYHAHLTGIERQELARLFHTTTDECMILICSYQMAVCGLNLQGNCRNSFEFDPPINKALQTQALGRINRVGQRHYVRAIRPSVNRSFDTLIANKAIMKSLEGLATELNLEIWGTEEDEEEEEEDSEQPVKIREVGQFVLCEGDFKREDDPAVQGKEYEPLTDDLLWIAIQQARAGQPIRIDGETRAAYEKHHALSGEGGEEELLGNSSVSPT